MWVGGCRRVNAEQKKRDIVSGEKLQDSINQQNKSFDSVEHESIVDGRVDQQAVMIQPNITDGWTRKRVSVGLSAS